MKLFGIILFSQNIRRHNVRLAVETMTGENSCLSGSLKGSRTGYGDWVSICAIMS